uniref:Si:dkey-246i14.3 n=1 Tax=Oncorhynchus mykiss TaxID=8022 RepID=A0A8K9VH55_ONCMY
SIILHFLSVTVWRTTVFLLNIACTASAKRHVVYWNSTNTRLTGGDLSIQVNLNDYLDIYCPHYPHLSPPSEEAYPQAPPDSLALYLVAEGGFKGCVETQGAIKRWECNIPRAPFGPVRFSEKIQRFTPFSLGFEFLPGHHYYYSCEWVEGAMSTVWPTPAPRSSAQIMSDLGPDSKSQ